MADITNEDIFDLDDEAFEEASTSYEEEAERVVDEPVSDGSNETTEVVETSEQTDTEEEPTEVVETEDDIPAVNEEVEETEAEESPNDTEDVTEPVDINYETSYAEVMKPIKSGGKEVVVKSIEDMRKFAGMGISFAENMRGVKPLRAIGKTLEEAGIIKDGVADEAALLRLLDIQNGNKDALAQLMKEQDIDPLDMETEDINYATERTMATEQTVEVDSVEQELVRRGSVDNVIRELDSMDSRSKQFFNESPNALLKLDDDIKSGAYEKIMGTVRYERSLGNIDGMSDMDAYIQIASAQEAPQEPKPTAQPKPSTAKRKAAGIGSRAPAQKKQPINVDLVSMSDEDFEKFAEMGNVI